METAVNQQNIQSILAGGENKTTEFKRFIRDRAILGKTISAFANTDGGILIIGYDDQTEKIIGISKKEQQEIKSFVEYSDARNFCNLYSLDIEEKSLFIIEVKKKNGALQFYNGAAYVRTGCQAPCAWANPPWTTGSASSAHSWGISWRSEERS